MNGSSTEEAVHRATLRGHVEICRIDHWTKNVFVLPGVVVALSIEPDKMSLQLLVTLVVGLLAIGLLVSSNYVINELRDAPYDRNHPTKRSRPVPAGRVHVPLAYAQWLLLGVAGVALGFFVGAAFAAVLTALWLMGCVYNLQPIRSKDLAYADVISEAVNNPLRMLAGWYIVDPPAFAPASLLLSYWMVGCYFMAMKRFAEWRYIADAVQAATYRRSFAHYDGNVLLVSVMFYASASMLFLGAFIMRYRLSLVLGFPFIALVMALYLQLGLRDDSPVMNPELLYREPRLMAALVVCAAVLTLCLFYDFPFLARLFAPTAPTNPTG